MGAGQAPGTGVLRRPRPDIANAANAAARKKLIAALADSDSPADRALYDEFQAELRKAAGWSHLLRESGRYPLTGRGDINTYAVFAETARTVIGPTRPSWASSCPPASPLTRPPRRSSAISSSNVKLDLIPGFRNESATSGRRRPSAGMRFCLLTCLGSDAESRTARVRHSGKHP